jgi:molybdate transport system regulatory protein
LNQIHARVVDIQIHENISVVTFVSDNTYLKMMGLELDRKLKISSDVILRVKASSLALSLSPLDQSSISNQLACEIDSIEEGVLLCSIKLRFLKFDLQSIITMDSFKRLRLEKEQKVTAFFKASELFIVEVLS